MTMPSGPDWLRKKPIVQLQPKRRLNWGRIDQLLTIAAMLIVLVALTAYVLTRSPVAP